MRSLAWISLVSVSLALSTGCAAGSGGRSAAVGVSEAEAIHVSGEGEATARPDRMRLNLGVEAKAETLEVAMKDNVARMTTLRDALLKLGVKEEDLKTGQFSIAQVREPITVTVASPEVQTTKAPAPQAGTKRGKMVPTDIALPQPMHTEERWIERYVVNNTLEVTYSELERAGELITAAVSAGANNSWGLEFEVKDKKPLEKTAREAALKDARERAEQIAKSMGVTLGRVLSVTDGASGESGPVYGPMMKMAAMEAMPIMSGQSELRMQVRVVYAIEGR